jgi:RimJ/RimL family protein N-acetyltransferase
LIRGELINLRAVEREDAGLIHRWYNDPDAMSYWGQPRPAISLPAVQQQIETWLDGELRLHRPVCLMIETLVHETIGLIILSEHRVRDRFAVVSILVGNPDDRERGYGTDALETLADVAFSDWNLHRLILRSEAENERAHHVFRKAGFAEEARLREASYHDGAYHDLVVFARLSTETSPAE